MKNFLCPLCCNVGFASREELKEHLEKVTSSLNCPFCMISCKNVVNLIKHLDVCNASNNMTSKNLPLTSSNDSDHENNSQLTDDDDDDVDGYFCTVCDIKIPDVYKHIQQFHNGQEVILQDDDEDSDGSKPSTALNNFHSDSSTPKRKQEEVINGENYTSKKIKTEPVRGEAGENETFYCPQCNVSFLSLTEHASKYHQQDEVLVQEVSITDLFPETKRINNALCYTCSCCQKTISRKTTLAKHLKLTNFKRSKKGDVEGKTYGSDAEKSFGQEVDGVKLDAGTEFEIEEVKLDNFDFDELGHSMGHSVFSAGS